MLFRSRFTSRLPSDCTEPDPWIEVITGPTGSVTNARYIRDHDKACEGQFPMGKPLLGMEDVGAGRWQIPAGTLMRVYRQYAYSCKDSSSTPEINTAQWPCYVVHPAQANVPDNQWGIDPDKLWLIRVEDAIKKV